MRILIATNNPSKLERVRQLLAGTGIEALSPADLGIPAVDVEEGNDLDQNAEAKAKAYAGKTDLPILGMDTAFVIPGENIEPAMVKRNALDGRDESSMTCDEIANAMVEFYRKIAARHGGTAKALWKDVFALILPDGSVKREYGERPVTLTGEVRGKVDPHLPLRSMYIVESTGKYTADHTPEEHLIELRPYQDALKRLLGIG
ncbi:hypothetical protein HY479_03735 [Candidatus Uhrbacteria bacterium]|nr:hypothetical protein [Candidatus Uhrbacteria bacterium]